MGATCRPPLFRDAFAAVGTKAACGRRLYVQPETNGSHLGWAGQARLWDRHAGCEKACARADM